jgi:hypothetical protein
MKGKLVTKMDDWNILFIQRLLGLRNGTLCNKELAIQLLDIIMKAFYQDSYNIN